MSIIDYPVFLMTQIRSVDTAVFITARKPILDLQPTYPQTQASPSNVPNTNLALALASPRSTASALV